MALKSAWASVAVLAVAIAVLGGVQWPGSSTDGGGGFGPIFAAAQRRPLPNPAPPVELNPSILVLGTFDYIPYQAAPPFTSRCTDMVDRSMQRAGGTRLAWVPTVYWVSSKPDKSDVVGYCFMDGIDGTTQCLPATQALIDGFRQGLELCMQLASNIGVNELAVVPHLDESTRLSAAWRNAIVFNPLEKLGGFTYEEVLLNPIADALGAVAKPWSIIHFALQGEMSATVMRYPREYLPLVERVRQRVIAAAASRGTVLPPDQVRVGLSFNYNKVELGGLQPVAPLSSVQLFQASGPSDSDTAPTAPAPAPAPAPAAATPAPAPAAATPAPAAAAPAAPAKAPAATAAATAAAPVAAAAATAAAPVAAAAATAAAPVAAAAAPGKLAATPAAALPRVVQASGEGAGRKLLQGQLRQWLGGLLGGDGGGAAAGGPPAPAAPPTSSSTVNTEAVVTLLRACDFIGISAYAALTPSFSTNELQNSAFTFYNEMRASTGIDLARIMREENIPLHYSEFGLGGGKSIDGTVVATTPAEAAKFPFFGTYPKQYTASLDPWTNPGVRDFMTSFWARTLQWLAQGGGPTYPIEACFMWTMGSYDILAIYPESTGPEGSYLQQAVSGRILQHNRVTSAANRQAMLAGR